jgi:hypothetical protein
MFNKKNTGLKIRLLIQLQQIIFKINKPAYSNKNSKVCHTLLHLPITDLIKVNNILKLKFFESLKQEKSFIYHKLKMSFHHMVGVIVNLITLINRILKGRSVGRSFVFFFQTSCCIKIVPIYYRHYDQPFFFFQQH